MLKAFREAEKMQKHLASTGALMAIADLQRMHEQIASSGVLKAVAEAEKVQKHLSTTGALKAIADIQRMHEQITTSGVLAAIAEAQKVQKYLASSGMFNAIAEMQRVINKKIASSAIFNAALRISEITDKVRDLQFTVDPNGIIASSHAAFSISQVENIVSSCINDSSLTADSIPVEIRINNFLTAIAKQHPLITKIVVLLLLPILINIVTSNNPSITVVNNQTILINQIKKEVNKADVNKDFYNTYRFVSSNSLNVWSKDTIKSRLIGKLYFGQLVRIVRKKRNWSLIEYKSSDGEVVIEGWVFTRYVKRFD